MSDDTGMDAGFPQWLLGEHRSYLFRFAVARLEDADLAHDAVQDTLLAALEKSTSFAGKSSLRTWLTAILKHKIIDLKRKLTRETAVSQLGATDSELEIDDLADDHEEGAELAAGSSWGSPEGALEQQRFWEVFERGLARLPQNAAQALVMREIMGQGTEDICKHLGVTATNCWVLMHRGRMAMRDYLDEHWFNANGSKEDIPVHVSGNKPAPVGSDDAPYSVALEKLVA